MKTMKKLVAALLVLTMVLALTGTAMAENKFKVGDYAKFTKNINLYSDHHLSKKTDTIVRKGSWALVVDTFGSHWVELMLSAPAYTKDGVEYPVVPRFAWVKTDDMKKINQKIKKIEFKLPGGGKQLIGTTDIWVVYSNKGNDYSDPFVLYVDGASPAGTKVEATAKVWMRKTYGLQKNFGRALHSGDQVKYRYFVGFDSRLVGFYGIRYDGKNLWVSSEYSKLVK